MQWSACRIWHTFSSAAVRLPMWGCDVVLLSKIQGLFPAEGNKMALGTVLFYVFWMLCIIMLYLYVRDRPLNQIRFAGLVLVGELPLLWHLGAEFGPRRRR